MTKNVPLKVIAGAPDKPLTIRGIEIPCYVLEDETRVLVQTNLFAGVGISRAGPRKETGTRIPRFMGSKSIKPFISKMLQHGLENPIVFKRDGTGAISYGYRAEILVDICNSILEARAANALRPNQQKMAHACDVLIRSIAKVGIIALVDEATGYQEIRARRNLATILEKFLARELQPWTKTFPYEFYQEIFRLRAWPGPDGVKKPQVIGHYTNDMVYARLAPAVLRELKRRNPTLPTGRRRHTHHQWFTPDIGHPKLKEHLAAVIALMRASPNWMVFQRNLQRAFPRLNEQIPLAID